MNNLRHCCCGKLLVATRPKTTFILGMTSASYTFEPSRTRFFKSVQVKTHSL